MHLLSVALFFLSGLTLAQVAGSHSHESHHHHEDALALLEMGLLDEALAVAADSGHHGPSTAVPGTYEALCAQLCRARGFPLMAEAWVREGAESAARWTPDSPSAWKGAWSGLAAASADPQYSALLRRLALARGRDAESVSAALHEVAPLPPRHRDDPIRLGTGRHTYQWVRNWAKLPAGMKFGNTHGCIAVDADGLVYLNTDTEHAVMVFRANGEFVRSFGKDLAGGLHGMIIVKQGDQEVVWAAHHGQNRVVCLSKSGEVLKELPFPEGSGHYKSKGEYHPTSVAVAADGSLFVADGYGKNWIHRYDAAGNYVGSFGGRGAEPGQFHTAHGLWMDHAGEEPRLLVADRENHRLQSFSMKQESKGVISGHLRRPCNLAFDGKDFAVADLAGRVTILDRDGQLLCHLGDQPDEAKRANNGVALDQWKDGEFISPHSACFDSAGNLYVMDWLALGRITKLERVQ